MGDIALYELRSHIAAPVTMATFLLSVNVGGVVSSWRMSSKCEAEAQLEMGASTYLYQK